MPELDEVELVSGSVTMATGDSASLGEMGVSGWRVGLVGFEVTEDLGVPVWLPGEGMASEMDGSLGFPLTWTEPADKSWLAWHECIEISW